VQAIKVYGERNYTGSHILRRDYIELRSQPYTPTDLLRQLIEQQVEWASVEALKYRKIPFLCRNSNEITLDCCLKCTSLYITDNRTFLSVLTAVIIGSFLSFQLGTEPLCFDRLVRSTLTIPTALSQAHSYINIVYKILTNDINS
jgi:hypothetical protein